MIKELNGNRRLRRQTVPAGWMLCQGYSNAQGFGQVQIWRWAEPGNFKDKKLQPARQAKEAAEDNHIVHALFFSPRPASGAVQVAPSSSRDITAGTGLVGTMKTHHQGWGHQEGQGCKDARGHLPPPGWQQCIGLNKLILIGWGLSHALHMWLWQGSKQYFCSPGQHTLFVLVDIQEDYWLSLSKRSQICGAWLLEYPTHSWCTWVGKS